MTQTKLFRTEISNKKDEECLNCERNCNKQYVKRIFKDDMTLKRKYYDKGEQQPSDCYVVEFSNESGVKVFQPFVFYNCFSCQNSTCKRDHDKEDDR